MEILRFDQFHDFLVFKYYFVAADYNSPDWFPAHSMDSGIGNLFWCMADVVMFPCNAALCRILYHFTGTSTAREHTEYDIAF